MLKLFICLFSILPLYVIAQPSSNLTKEELSSLYIKAIGDFITEAQNRNKIFFDTLYFGNRKDNDPYNDFPDLNLPETIGKTVLVLIAPEQALHTQNEHKYRIYINMIGWATKENAEFLFYVFSNGFEHKFNYRFIYTFKSKQKGYQLTKVQLKKPPFE